VTAPVSTARRLPREVRQQQMLDAAVEIFSARGYHGASMDEIAERAGVSKPLLYMYLGSKEETFRACIAREAGRLADTITAATAGDAADAAGGAVPDPAHRLWRGLTAFFQFVAEHRSSWMVLYQQARTRGDAVAEQLAQVRQAIIGTVTGLVAEDMAARAAGTPPRAAGTPAAGTPPRAAGTPAAGTPAAADAARHREAAAIAHSLVGAADAMAEWALAHPDEAPEATARRLMNIVWIGLERRAAGERFRPPGP
jgi:AcrR family transcriptional regulator